jgi:hypothetical protein
MESARELARCKTNARLHVVRSFWCVLPAVSDPARKAQIEAVQAGLAEIPGYREIDANAKPADPLIESRRARVAQIPSFAHSIVLETPTGGSIHAKGAVIRCTGTVTNTSGVDWPVEIDGVVCLAVGFELHHKQAQRKIASARAPISGNSFNAGESRKFDVVFRLHPHTTIGACELRIDLVYDYVCWFARKGAEPLSTDIEIVPEFRIDTVNPELAPADPAFWKQYVPEYNPHSPIGINSPAFQEYVVHNPSGTQQVRSMLSVYEISLLYALARDYSGEGQILDLGPLMGLTTNALARGLIHNTREIHKRKRIFSYDLFLLENMNHFLKLPDGGSIGSVFPGFLELNRDFLDYIVPVPGDLLKMSWTGEPIEIMFIDISKSFHINRHLLQNFFPHLLPEKAIVVQQDFLHVEEYWLPLTMEHLADHFEPLYCVFGAMAVFRLKEPIPEALLAEDIGTLPLDRCESYFDRAIEKAKPTAREILRCCKAMNYLRFNAHDQARACLQAVDFSAREQSNDPTADFSSLIAPQAQVVDKLLRKASGAGAFNEPK